MELKIIEEACLAFLQVATKAEGKNRLESLLIRLSKLQEVTLSIDPFEAPLSSLKHPEEQENLDNLRSKLSEAYPNLGLYHCLSCTDLGREPEIYIGDAIDDLLDIYREVTLAMSTWKKEPLTAVSDLKISYWNHWGRHLNNLQKIIFESLHNET